MSNSAYLVLGTSSMVLMMMAIIGFIYLYSRKLSAKAREFKEIEQLMQKQELRLAHFLIEGQEQERKRIAAELHDNIGGLLATLKIYSDLVLTKSDLDEVTRLNEKINSISSTLSAEVRQLSHELDLRTLSGFGLKVALEQLCEAINGSGKLKVSSFIDMHKPFHDDISLHLYRIVQELFTNTLKHALATTVRLEVSQIENDLVMIFEDNGRGFDTAAGGKTGVGLQNIRSRANRIAGKLTIDSSANGSTFILEVSNYE